MSVDIAVLSLLCGHRRTATVFMGGEGPSTQFVWLPNWPGGGAHHHGISHHVAIDSHDTGGHDEAFYDPILQAIDRWHAEALFGRAARRLLEIPDEAGTMLGRIGVVMMNGFSAGRGHLKTDLPFVLAGSMGGYFRQGSYERVGDGTRAHNGFLTMLGQAAGLSIDSFGEPEYSSETHPELRPG
jgi:hypothetical protein